MGKVVTREWRKAKSAKLEFAVVSAFRDDSSFGLDILGPLCLWQCFTILSSLKQTLTQALLAKYSSSWFSLNLTVSHKLYLLVLYFLQHPQAILGFPPQPPLLVVSNSHTNCTR